MSGGKFGNEKFEDKDAVDKFKSPGASTSASNGVLSGNQASIYVYAARYAHTRKTAASMQIVNEILSVWHRLPMDVRKQLQREAETEVTHNHEDWVRLIAR